MSFFLEIESATLYVLPISPSDLTRTPEPVVGLGVLVDQSSITRSQSVPPTMEPVFPFMLATTSASPMRRRLEYSSIFRHAPPTFSLTEPPTGCGRHAASFHPRPRIGSRSPHKDEERETQRSRTYDARRKAREPPWLPRIIQRQGKSV